MKIINKTNWDTLDLKKVLTRALDEDDKVEGKYGYRSYLEVTISYSKGYPSWVVKRYQERNKELPVRERYSGNAWVGGTRMVLRVPRGKIDTRLLSRVFKHELDHCRGFKHNQMGGRYLDTKDLGRDNWALSYPIRQKEARVEPKPDLQVRRYEHVLEMLKAKKSQLKRLQNQIKKWNQKRKYYESVLVASGKIKEEKKING